LLYIKQNLTILHPVRECFALNEQINGTVCEIGDNSLGNEGLFPVDNEILHLHIFTEKHSNRLHLPAVQKACLNSSVHFSYKADIFHVFEQNSQLSRRQNIGVGKPKLSFKFRQKIIVPCFKNEFRIYRMITKQLGQRKRTLTTWKNPVILQNDLIHDVLLFASFLF